MQQPPIIVVAGPTASGKTRLAVELAKELAGEVVSCDSMQVYRRMDIGTAKPTTEEMDGVVHHMIDVAEPDEAFSVGRYVAMADPIVARLLAQGKAVIVCGGTGLYADSLILGRTFAPVPQTGRRKALEALADQAGIETLLAQLAAVDPASAARLHPGPGGVSHHRQDHHPAQPGFPGHAAQVPRPLAGAHLFRPGHAL